MLALAVLMILSALALTRPRATEVAEDAPAFPAPPPDQRSARATPADALPHEAPLGGGSVPAHPPVPAPAIRARDAAHPRPRTRPAPTEVPADELAPDALIVPVAGVARSALVPSFDDARDGGRTHEAIDILAPRGTPVLAAGDGRVVKLFESEPGGLTVYQFDPAGRWVYYYAHLERYAPGLDEGDAVEAGDVLGYVGTSGNAPASVPHLHFAVMRLGPEKQWWNATAIDPFPLLHDPAD
jgi:murein DD-endopeptidase MepM/ murein hydrolase activator NlpD